ncbi:MAG: hypothetical protein BZY80_05580 [SAR202 cluster bacterium Io17-Chloro-G2]|nr:MAG: hypothetical protein BZY80_05580 [SAR202 cluster bacterium Io17-Chloro-G2]
MTIRRAYADAVDFFVNTVQQTPDGGWDCPALGVWTVRDLAGHACRSLTLIGEYAAHPASQADIHSPAEYFKNALDGPPVHDSIAQRGKEAGLALGDDPVGWVRDAADGVLALLEGMEDEAVLGLPLGGIRLADYLPTRTFELTVHTLDLAEASNLKVQPPVQAMSQTLHILADLALLRGHGPAAALALTGRHSLPAGFSLVG